MALVPDLVLYLEIDVDTLVPRMVRGKGMDYWESGMHLALSSDIFDSFQNYQRRIIDEYNRLAHDFGFITIDARESISKIQSDVRSHVSDYLRRAQSGLHALAEPKVP
jgi:dTMP kinase